MTDDESKIRKLIRRIDELNTKCTQVLTFLSFAIVAAVLLLTNKYFPKSPNQKDLVERAAEFWVWAIFPILGGIVPLKDFWPDSSCWLCFVRWLKVILLWLAIVSIFWGTIDFFRGI